MENEKLRILSEMYANQHRLLPFTRSPLVLIVVGAQPLRLVPCN